MTRMTPAKFVAENKNAPGGGVAAPASTEGVRMPTQPNQEDMMTKSIPSRPWLDDATAKYLTDTDLADFDAKFARWSADNAARPLGIDLVEYLRDCARDQAKVRQIMGPHDVPLPEFATVHKDVPWELNDDGTDCIRCIDAIYADHKGMDASLEVDQYAVSTRMDLRVRIGEGMAETPADLTRWALDLLALAGTWTEILEEQS